MANPIRYRLVQGEANSFEPNLNAAADDGWTLHSFTVQGSLFIAVMYLQEPAGDKVW